MRSFSNIYKIPNVPAVYALFSGSGNQRYVAYVGIAGKLKQRLIQHFIRKDSSVTTGTSAVCLKPEYITSISWWEHPKFEQAEFLMAAEMVAFDVLNPALRSRGAADSSGKEILTDLKTYNELITLFNGKPSGNALLPSMADVLERVECLENRIKEIEEIISKLKDKE